MSHHTLTMSQTYVVKYKLVLCEYSEFQIE